MFNKWFPCSNSMVKFSDRFKVIQKGGPHTYCPEGMLLRWGSDRLYGIPLPGELETSFTDYRPGWNRESLVFRHPKFPYSIDWPHYSDGSCPNNYNFTQDIQNRCPELPADVRKILPKLVDPDNTGYSELEQYAKDVRCSREPLGYTQAANWLVASDHIYEHAADGRGYFNAASSCWLDLKRLIDILGIPTVCGSEAKDRHKQLVYTFYDATRRGVYFHLFLYEDYFNLVRADGDIGFSYEDVVDLILEEVDRVKKWPDVAIPLPNEKLKSLYLPFLITMRAEGVGGMPFSYSSGDWHSSREREYKAFAAYRTQLSQQYTRLFEIWLTNQFKPANQLSYSITDDALPRQYIDRGVPTVNLKLTNLI